jgi:hypothetical protein
MPVDWELVARALAAKVVETGKKALEQGVDSVLADVEEGVTKAFDESKRRIARARSRVAPPPIDPASVKETIVVEAEIVDPPKKASKSSKERK